MRAELSGAFVAASSGILGFPRGVLGSFFAIGLSKFCGGTPWPACPGPGLADVQPILHFYKRGVSR